MEKIKAFVRFEERCKEIKKNAKELDNSGLAFAFMFCVSLGVVFCYIGVDWWFVPSSVCFLLGLLFGIVLLIFEIDN